MSEQAYRDGLEVKRQLFGAGKEHPLPPGHLADDLLRLSDELVYGRVYTRPGLDLRTRSMLTVAALTVLGRDDYLRRHLQGALHVGVTPAEIKEILMQMTTSSRTVIWTAEPGSFRTWRTSSGSRRRASLMGTFTAQPPGGTGWPPAEPTPSRQGQSQVRVPTSER